MNKTKKWPFREQVYHVKLPRNHIKITTIVYNGYGLSVLNLEAISPVFSLIRFLGAYKIPLEGV